MPRSRYGAVLSLQTAAVCACTQQNIKGEKQKKKKRELKN
jgi:hypothetical protein